MNNDIIIEVNDVENINREGMCDKDSNENQYDFSENTGQLSTGLTNNNFKIENGNNFENVISNLEYFSLNKKNQNINEVEIEKEEEKKEEDINNTFVFNDLFIKFNKNLNKLYEIQKEKENEILKLEERKKELEAFNKNLETIKIEYENKLKELKNAQNKLEFDKSKLEIDYNKNITELKNEKDKLEKEKMELKKEIDKERLKFEKEIKNERLKFEKEIENERLKFEKEKANFEKEKLAFEKEKQKINDNKCVSNQINNKINNEDNEEDISNEELNKNNISDDEDEYEEALPFPKGLLNLGLSCYMNSLLQCLYYIPEFREYFINNKKNYDDEHPVCKALADVMYGLKYDKKDYFVAEEFKKIMGNKNKLFLGVKAGDSKDLYFNLIDSLLTELNVEQSIEEEDENEIDLSNKLDVFKELEKESKKDNIINQLLIGYYETIYYCPNNKKKLTYSFQSESFILFELEKIKKFCNTNELTIEKCFNYFYRLQEKTSFYCNYCQKVEVGSSCDKIYRPSKILVIILDRGHGKIFKGKIEINQYIDLKYCIDEENYEDSTLYKLICISTHTGSSSPTGHYTARCLTENNVYYYFSDTERYQINEDKIFGGDPYILFYKRMNKEESINNYNIILKNQIINIDKEKFEKRVEKREQNNKKEEEKEDKKKKKGKKEEKGEDKNQKKEEE